jgi:hypothetical protein
MKDVNLPEVAKKIAISKKLARAFKYDLHVREYDEKVEVVGLIDDPTLSLSDFKGREAMFPKKWVTLDVLTMNEAESYCV